MIASEHTVADDSGAEDHADIARADAEARTRIVSDLESSFIVEAAAGTGKTTMLVERLVSVLAAGKADIDGVAAVTFTKKAAGELKLRLRQALDSRRASSADADERHRIEDAITRLEEAHIGTIHAFCAEILRQRPVEAGVDPSFAELDQAESQALFDRAFRSWIEHRLGDLPETLERILARLAGRRTLDGSAPLDRLRDAAWRLVDWRDFPAPWQRRPFDRASAIERLIAEVHALANAHAACPNPRDYLRLALDPVARLWSWLRASARAGGWTLGDPALIGDATPGHGTEPSATGSDDPAPRPARDDHAIEARLIRLYFELRRDARKGRGKQFAPGLDRDVVIAGRSALVARLDAFRIEANAHLAAALRDELAEAVEGYEALKRRDGRLDFLDLLIRTRELLRDSPGVRRTLQARYSHIFVDEFQDTDPLQAEILLLLGARDPAIDDWRQAVPKKGKLFLVGDPKQSIYRFRRADVALYESIKRRLLSMDVELLYLARSFRSVPALQRMVNGAFAPVMVGDPEAGQPDYVPLLAGRETGAAENEATEDEAGENEAGRETSSPPRVIALPVPRPYGLYGVYAREIESSLPGAIAAHIDWMLHESGWTVEEGGAQVAIRPRHIALLFRRFAAWGRDAAAPYVRALESRGIPHLLLGDRSFFARPEIETLRAAMNAVEWPSDELAVFATLRGTLFAVADDVLLRYRGQIGRLDPFRPATETDDGDFGPIVEALALLRRLHRQRNRRPVAETLIELLTVTRAHVGFALRPAGNQVLSNVDRIVGLARGFETGGGLSFRGFVDQLEEAASNPGAAPTPPIVEEGADGVRLMTVHAAKGLEFEVVVLADLTTRMVREEPDHFADPEGGLFAQQLLGMAPWELHEHAESEMTRDRAEGVRLAYVAATRARDLLVVPAIGDEPYRDGWLSPLDRAIYPPEAARRDARRAAGCPTVGDVSVLHRPQKFDGESERSVRPGLHTAEAGNEVVWWDPGTLEGGQGPSRGLHHEALLGEGPAAAAGHRRHREWQVAQDDARTRGETPSKNVVAVGDAPEPEALYLVEVETRTLPRTGPQPTGKRFGTLIHDILRDVAFDASAAQVADLARLHGRIHRAEAIEIEAAVTRVTAALDDDLLRRAAGAEDVRREMPFVVDVDGVLIEGIIDLAFLEDERWTVVDFKTDADTRALESRYRRQIAWYLIAIERLTDLPARGVLLAV